MAKYRRVNVGSAAARRRAFRLGFTSVIDLTGGSYKVLQEQIRSQPRPHKRQPAAAASETMRVALHEHKHHAISA